MIRHELIEIISPFNFWEGDLETGYVRNPYLDRFESYLKIPSTTVAVTGVRRCGKTYLCRQLIKRSIEKGMDPRSSVFINLEDPAFEPYLGPRLLDDILESYMHFIKPKGMIHLFIDEAQAIEGWERWVRSMIDKSSNMKIIVTGSSSRIMTQELSSLLTGRTMELRLQPFSFAEFLDYRDVKYDMWNEKRMQSLLLEYLETGGFPQVQSIDDQILKDEFLKELFHSMINRDIVNRFGVREVHKLKSMATLLLNNISGLTSVTKMMNTMNSLGIKISSATISEYFSYLSESLIFYFIPIISYKAKDIEQYPKKLYCVDTGMIRSVKRPKRMDYGSISENVVAMELIRRHGKENIFYWKGRGEVDFVVINGDERKLIQVSWDLEDSKTRKREIKGLLEAEAELGASEKIVLTVERIDLGSEVQVIPITEWLLKDRP
ncbi:MAG: ATP-binding protein [Candidatus Thermoplasmatota archaeon]|nr:ATP-binding protein [Candidatus Thermoplasmatota archaeon]